MVGGNGFGSMNGNNGGQGLSMVPGNSNVNNSNNNNNMAALQAMAAGNPLAALLLQNQQANMNLEAALSQVTSWNNGMIMPSNTTVATNQLNQANANNMLLAARLGGTIGNLGGNFSGLGAVGKPGSVLDPRLTSGATACFNGTIAPPTKPMRKPVSLYLECDMDSLSEYQCIIRQQIELFEADKFEAGSSVQGRNKQIVEGQVGIRCRHCAHVPTRQRQKGSMYFPTKLDRIYQAAQNLSTYHLCENCKHVPDHVRKAILVLRERKSPAGGGKRYWGDGVRSIGVVEVEAGLRFR
ncbi:MAG: hypothetical protein SGILL_001168 [Bacillariaceae sp.]